MFGTPCILTNKPQRANSPLSLFKFDQSLSPNAIYFERVSKKHRRLSISRQGDRPNNNPPLGSGNEKRASVKRRRSSASLPPSLPSRRRDSNGSRTERRRCNGSSRLETVLYSWPGFSQLSRMLMRRGVTTVLCPWQRSFSIGIRSWSWEPVCGILSTKFPLATPLVSREENSSAA